MADVNGDGKLDLLVANERDNTVSVLLGNGISFQPAHAFAAGAGPASVAVADLNGDGRPELLVANSYDNTVSVLQGNDDGSFQTEPAFATGFHPSSEVVADINRDGKPDLVVVNQRDDTVSVLLSNGDGTFQPQRRFDAGTYPSGVVVADVNGDGRPDFVTANRNDSTVGVLLGNGDGSFQPQHAFAAGSYPTAAAVADVNGDGKLDLVVTNSDNTVSVLLGNGDGSFQPQQPFDAGSGPRSVAVADVNGDGKPDLVLANSSGNSVSVLLGNGDSSFREEQRYSVGAFPAVAVAVADVNGDGKPDLVAAYSGRFISGRFYSYYGYYYSYSSSGRVSVLLGNGDGSFQDPRTFAVDYGPQAVAVADVNGDGKPDLVAAIFGTSNQVDRKVSVLLGNGDGSFQDQRTFAVGYGPRSVAVGDVNGDGRPDLLAANSYDNTVSVLLGSGDGSFAPIAPTSGLGFRNTPYLADLNHDGTLDSVILDRSGHLLFRQGLPGADSPFAPPVTLNDKLHLGRDLPARDLTVLHTRAGWAIATVDSLPDPNLSTPNHFLYTVSLYAVAANGKVTRTIAFSTSLLPTRLAAADLTGNGLDDLIVANSLDNSIQVAFQQGNGTFGSPRTLTTGETPSDIALMDANGDGLIDIMISNQASGDVSVFLNDPSHSFTTGYRFRAGTGLYSLDTTAARPAVSSVGQSASVAAGDFTGDGRNDLVVINRGAHNFTVLSNDGSGFTDPQAALTTSTSDGFRINDRPGPVVAGDFNRDGNLDLAILMEDQSEVWIYTGDGQGQFHHTFSVAAGASPTGLSVVRNPRTDFLDLLVGNPFGDVLHLQGKGDGTFQLAGSRTSLAVQDLGNGQPNALVANQQTNRVTIQAPTPGAPQFVPVVTLADGSQGTLAPGAVQWAKLDGPADLFFDAVVVASGANSVLVYRGTGFDSAGHPTFAAPQTYFVGNDPVNATIQDLNGDGIPDMLIADQGSNDVFTLFGSLDASGYWAGMAGPRLNSGGAGPIGTTLRDLNGDSIPDLVVTNGQSGTLTVLPGRGQGFFDDRNPLPLTIPGNPVLTQSPTFFAPGQGVVVTGDGRLVGFDLDAFAATVRTVFTPPLGQAVTAVQALVDGTLVAAEQGGTVALLAFDLASQAFAAVENLTALTGMPSDPSALAVLESASGRLVLVTNEGDDQLFVFAFGTPNPSPGVPTVPSFLVEGLTGANGLPGPFFVMLPEIVPPSSPLAEATAPSEAPLALVLVLVAADLPAPGGANEADDSLAEANSPPAGAAFKPSGGDAAVEDPSQGAQASEEPQLGIDVDEALRQLDLYRRTEDPDADGPMSRQQSPVGPLPWDTALAAFWEAPGNALALPARDVPLLADVCGFTPSPAMLEDAFGGTTEQPPDERTTIGSPNEMAFAADPRSIADSDVAPEVLISALALVGLFGRWVGLDTSASGGVHPRRPDRRDKPGGSRTTRRSLSAHD